METQAVAIAVKSRASVFEALVERTFREQNTFQGFEGTIESVLRVHFSRMSAQNHVWKRETFRDLLLMFYAKKCYTVLRNPAYIEVLANISAFGNKTVRDIADWKKDSLTAEGQLSSLIRHCFAQFEVPAFMENAFGGESKVQMLWYIQLGRGDSVQQLSAFPVAFTKKMAHEFRATTKDCSIPKAIRRAQALGYGATVNRADAIAWSTLSDSFENEAFYSTVVQFMARLSEDITFDKLQGVLEFIASEKAANADYSMKGRTWSALVRQSAEWHIEMAKKREAEGFSEWKLAPISNYIVDEGDCAIKIVQLTTSSALYEEGYEMSHCVAEYDEDCASGKIAIFSVRKFTKGEAGFETLATLEVFLEEMEIVQAKARFNGMICEIAHQIVREWALRERLAMCYDFISAEQLAAMQAAAPVVQPEPAYPGVGQEQERQLNNYARALEERPAYRPHAVNPDTIIVGRGLGSKETLYIIFFIIKILWLIAKCS